MLKKVIRYLEMKEVNSGSNVVIFLSENDSSAQFFLWIITCVISRTRNL